MELKPELKKSIDNYFENTTPDDIIKIFEEMGVKFEDINESNKIDMEEKTLYGRVVTEMKVYDNAKQAAIDHLNMAESHLFEEFEGRDIENLLTDIKLLREKIEEKLPW